MRKHTFVVLFSLLVLVAFGSVVFAQTGDGFDLTWHVMGGAGGVGPLTGDGFSLDGTQGQTAIGPAVGDDWLLGQGYWYGMGEVAPPVFGIYLPIVTKAP